MIYLCENAISIVKERFIVEKYSFSCLTLYYKLR
jgi:hypothetical protein